MEPNDKIYVAGHKGLVGSAIVRRLRSSGFHNLVLRSHAQLDLTSADQVEVFFADEQPRFVFLAAARVGGILANDSLPVAFLRENLQIELNVIESAFRHGVRKLQFLGSSCIYPKLAAQPLHETSLLNGPLEPTNEWYAIAKIAGIKLCQAYAKQYGFDAISLMPTNLYGPGDNFHPQHSHVLPALLYRIHEAAQNSEPEVAVWGSGEALREFLFVNDLADAALFLMQHYDSSDVINVGTGQDVSIRHLAELICELVGYTGTLRFDRSKPDGTPRKLLDVTKIQSLGWRAKTNLADGLRQTYRWFLNHQDQLRGLQPASH